MSLASSLLASSAGKDYTKFRRARARTPNASHSFRILVLLAKASPPLFIATRDTTGGQPVDATVVAFTDAFMNAFKDAIMQIFHTVTSHVSTE